MASTTPPRETPPDHAGVIAASVVMMLVGWGGLYLLVTTTLPRVGELWVFFLLLHVAVTATVLPLVRYINLLFTPSTRQPPPGGVLVRQSVWVGLFVVACAWLQIPRVLTPVVALFVALALIVVEVFIRAREIPNERYE